MGFVKGTDGIARTMLNPLEGSIGDVALNNISATNLNTGTVSASGAVTAASVVGGVITGTSTSVSGTTTAASVVGGVITGTLVSVSGNVTGGNLLTGGLISAGGNITGNTAGFAIGYRDIPQVAFTANATTATTDAGKHYYSTQSTSYILTIANNASQGFQTGAAISIVNQGTGNITVAQGSGVTLYLGGNATSGNRIVSTFGMATLIKVATDIWFINGTGVS